MRCIGLSEPALAELALTGSPDAWDEIARRHTRKVIVALLARGVPLDEAEDAAQSAWLRLVEQQRSGRLTSMKLPGLAIVQADWLARESRRTRLRRLAIAAVVPPAVPACGEAEGQDPRGDPERQMIMGERMEVVRRAIEGCPPRAREVFRAVYGADARNHADVALELGLSLQRVRQTLCEVRARVRAALAAAEREDAR